jgi:hypothetical protein
LKKKKQKGIFLREEKSEIFSFADDPSQFMLSGYAPRKLFRNRGRGNLVLEIEKRAFAPLLPMLAKPRLELGVWPNRKAPFLLAGKSFPKLPLQGITWKEIRNPAGEGGGIPIHSQRAGSILMILPEGFVCGLKRLLHESYRVLDMGGRIAIGFIPRESPWAQFYRKKRKSLLSLTPPPRIYSLKEMEHRMMEAGFSIQGYVCTLFQKPGQAKEFENPFRGYHLHAGFLVLLGERRTREI